MSKSKMYNRWSLFFLGATIGNLICEFLPPYSISSFLVFFITFCIFCGIGDDERRKERQEKFNTEAKRVRKAIQDSREKMIK